jgi:hypothetical protein
MTKDFLPPKSDVVFGLLFGDIRNVDLLSDFLKSVLTLPQDDLSEITIVDPYLLRKYPDKKLGILDLRARAIIIASLSMIHLRQLSFPTSLK